MFSGDDFSVMLYVLASSVFLSDFADMLVRLYLRRQQTGGSDRGVGQGTSVPLAVGTFTPYQVQLHVRPFAVVASVHNAGAQIDRFLKAMEPLKAEMWFIDDRSTDDTADRIVAAGFRCLRAEVNRGKPGALRRLVESLPEDVASILVMDPDVRILTSMEDLRQIVFELQRTEMAALTPRVAAAGNGWLARIQQLEYWVACSLGRKSLGDFTITSGVALYRADALRRIYRQHSLSVYAEDFENALILLAANEKIYYDGRFVIETDAIDTIPRLFSQRVGWYFGLIRVYSQRWRSIWPRARRQPYFAYQYLLYTGALVLLLHPVKLFALAVLALSAANGIDNLLRLDQIPDHTVSNPLYFVVIYLQCLGLMLLTWVVGVGRHDRMRVLPIVPLYPIYALAHFVPATVGYLNWLTLRLWGRVVYRDHYQPAS